MLPRMFKVFFYVFAAEFFSVMLWFTLLVTMYRPQSIITYYIIYARRDSFRSMSVTRKICYIQ